MKIKTLILVALLVLAVACAPTLQDKAAKTEVKTDKVVDQADTQAKTQAKIADADDTAKETVTKEAAEVSEVAENNSTKVVEETKTETMQEMPTNVTLLAGKTAKYYEWNKELFDSKVEAGKTVLLVFQSNKYYAFEAQEAELVEAFDNSAETNLVGFRVAFKDETATEETEELALKLGIATSNTKVILKAGNLVHKDGREWDSEHFARTLSKFT